MTGLAQKARTAQYMQHQWGKNDLNSFHKWGAPPVETRGGGTLAVKYLVVEFCLTFVSKHN